MAQALSRLPATAAVRLNSSSFVIALSPPQEGVIKAQKRISVVDQGWRTCACPPPRSTEPPGHVPTWCWWSRASSKQAVGKPPCGRWAVPGFEQTLQVFLTPLIQHKRKVQVSWGSRSTTAILPHTSSRGCHKNTVRSHLQSSVGKGYSRPHTKAAEGRF